MNKISKLQQIMQRKTTRTDDDVHVLLIDSKTGELLKDITNLKKEQKQQIIDWSLQNAQIK